LEVDLPPYWLKFLTLKSGIVVPPLDTNLAAFSGGAVAPLIAVGLLEIYKSVVPVAIYVALAAMLTITGVLMAPETRGRNLGEVGSLRNSHNRRLDYAARDSA
jgi:hypothetical protein